MRKVTISSETADGSEAIVSGADLGDPPMRCLQPCAGEHCVGKQTKDGGRSAQANLSHAAVMAAAVKVKGAVSLQVSESVSERWVRRATAWRKASTRLAPFLFSEWAIHAFRIGRPSYIF